MKKKSSKKAAFMRSARKGKGAPPKMMHKGANESASGNNADKALKGLRGY